MSVSIYSSHVLQKITFSHIPRAHNTAHTDVHRLSCCLFGSGVMFEAVGTQPKNAL